MAALFDNEWVWLFVTLVCLLACTYLPIKIKNDELRRWVMWVVLIPVSLVILLYVYPFGLEVFRRIAIAWH